MFEVHKINWFVVAGFSIAVYVVNYLDKMRILDPRYKHKLEQKRYKELKHRLMAFPMSNNMKEIKKFVILQIEKGEEYMVHHNYDKATEHFANGLSLINYNCELKKSLRTNMSLKIYEQINMQIQEIQNMLSKIRM